MYTEQQRAAASLSRWAAGRRMRVPRDGTSMVKALAESGLVDYEPRGGVG
jgi:Mn-dependent DtxR family transcriptional regulator